MTAFSRLLFVERVVEVGHVFTTDEDAGAAAVECGADEDAKNPAVAEWYPLGHQGRSKFELSFVWLLAVGHGGFWLFSPNLTIKKHPGAGE